MNYTNEQLAALANKGAEAAKAKAYPGDHRLLSISPDATYWKEDQPARIAFAQAVLDGAEEMNAKDEAHPVTILGELMKTDLEYAWSWHCNIAMACYDKGARPHSACNAGAALFLTRLFPGLDTTKHPAYEQTQEVTQRSPWIPCSERMPTQADGGPNGDVLWIKDGHAFARRWDDAYWRDLSSHWATIPPLPTVTTDHASEPVKYFTDNEHKEAKPILVTFTDGKINPPPFGAWHREDWTPEMLPEGWRPLMLGETGDYEILVPFEKSPQWTEGGYPATPAGAGHEYQRTRRPLPPAPEQPKEELPEVPEVPEGYRLCTKEEAGMGEKSTLWMKHVKMLIDTQWVDVVCQGVDWRIYACPNVEEFVPLSAEDVPPGSVFKPNDWKGPGYICMSSVRHTMVCFDIEPLYDCDQADKTAASWQRLFEGWQILRPGQTEWQPCKKPCTPSTQPV